MGKVKPNFSGVNHKGNIQWPVIPRYLRGTIIQPGQKPAAPRAPKKGGR